MELTFNEFSYRNAERCKNAFGRKIESDSAVVHSLKACAEVGEMVQDLARIIDPFDPKHTPKSEEAVKKMLFEAADAFTYLDLIASHFGYKFSDILIEKFNIVSDRVGSRIKIHQ